MTQQTNQKGFTLIELLITVAIIAILVTIALPAYSIYKDRVQFGEVIHATETSRTSAEVCINIEGNNNCYYDETDPDSTLFVPVGATNAAYVATVSMTRADTAATTPIVIIAKAAPDGTQDANQVVTVDWNNDCIGDPTATGCTNADAASFIMTGTINTTNNTIIWDRGGSCKTFGIC